MLAVLCFQCWLFVTGQLFSVLFHGNTTVPAPSFPQMGLVLCVEFSPNGFFPHTLACPCLSALFSLYLGSHVDGNL